MNTFLFTNLFLFVCSGFSFIYGLVNYLRHKKIPMYFLFVLFSMLSAFLSRLFYILAISFYGGLPQTFNIGFVGYAAMFLYMLFANFGQIDYLVDDGKSLKLRYKVLPAIIPLMELIFGIIALIYGTVGLSLKVTFLVITSVAGFAGYFNIKHLIVPDADLGIVKSIRGYNLIAVLIELFSLAEIGISIFGINTYIPIVQIIIGILYLIIIPVLLKEVKKWTI